MNDACGTSEFVNISAARPETATDENTVRAGLIRYLMLGGCAAQRPDVVGVNISGAVINGVLDLQDCRAPLSLSLVGCLFQQSVLFADCDLGLVNLSDSKMHGIDAGRGGFGAELDLSIVEVAGFVYLSRAKIHGLLDCSGGQFGAALVCDAMTVGASAFLRRGFSAAGDVVLRGAQIGGQLDCDGGQFDAGFELEACQVASSFLFRGASVQQDLNCHDMRVGTLSDDLKSWSTANEYNLNGFVYENLITADMNVAERIAWVQGNSVLVPPRQSEWMRAIGYATGQGYEPRPYRQLATIYEQLGHARSAAKVREAGERHRWQREQARSREALDGGFWPAVASLRVDAAWLGAQFLRVIAGFGHAPARAFGWAFLIVVCSMLFFSQGV